MSVSLGELAVRFGCELRGDPDLRVERVATLAGAGPTALAFMVNPKYRPLLGETRAGAVVLGAADAAGVARTVLIAPNPYATYARIASVLHPAPAAPPGVHATAWIAPLAQIDVSAHVGPHASVGGGTRIGARAVIGPGCVIEGDVEIAEDVRLVARVVICRGTRIGPRTIVQPGAVIGGDGFGYAPERGAWVKVPQVGRVVIGADVEIGANTTIDRGAIDDTVIEDGVKLDNLIQIGHNCHIGAHTAMAGCTGVAGSTRIGAHCTAGGSAMILGHLEIADHVHISAATVVSHSIRKPGHYSGFFPIDENAAWEKNAATLRQLHALRERVRALEKKS